MTNPILKLAGQTAIYGLSSIIGRLLNYILVPLYTLKFANPADYGVVSELYAWVAFLIVILAFGMETAYFRFTQDNHDEKSIFSSSLYVISSINLVFLILILLFHQSIADALLSSPSYFNGQPVHLLWSNRVILRHFTHHNFEVYEVFANV